MPENIQMICLVRLIVAAVCGLLIGVERQTRMKGAGSRTHMMVSLGAALMTLVSAYGFLPIVGAAGVSVDVSRVAASIAAGIGFLGAGVIFVHRGISIKRISCGCRRIFRVCSRLRYKRNSKAVRQKCRTAFVLIG